MEATKTLEKPKPVRELLRQLPEEYRELALRNNEAAAKEIDREHENTGKPALEQFEEATVPNTYLALKRAFKWSDSPEGRDFWKAKAKELYEQEGITVSHAIEISDESLREDLKNATNKVYESLDEPDKTNYLTARFPSYAHFIRYAFRWKDTPQGNIFWGQLYEEYAGDLPLEEGDVA